MVCTLCNDSGTVDCPDCEGGGEICTYYDVCSDTGDYQICDCCGGSGKLECPEHNDSRLPSMLTDKEKATNNDTFRHIERVRNLLNACVVELLDRAEKHDQSKLEPPEVSVFAEYTPKLAACTYGSDEYKGYLKDIKPALDHHYAFNRHHPEHHKNGVDDMNLLDLVEMLCDWKAASERHNNGNIRKSIEINADRFGLSPQMVKILENTVNAMFKD